MQAALTRWKVLDQVAGGMDDTLRVRTRICITMYISKYPVIAATVTESACVCYTSWMARESRGQIWKAVINAAYRTV